MNYVGFAVLLSALVAVCKRLMTYGVRSLIINAEEPTTFKKLCLCLSVLWSNVWFLGRGRWVNLKDVWQVYDKIG